MKRVQCKACPWRKDVAPERDIPNGYDAKKHANLVVTIAEPGALSFDHVHRMACHESAPGAEFECVGWVMHQLNEGNNIAMRLEACDGRYNGFRTVGPQHSRFEDTLPKGSRRQRGKS